MRTLRTNRETTPEGFHDEVLSDHITRNHEASQQVNDPQSLPVHEVARVRSDQVIRWYPLAQASLNQRVGRAARKLWPEEAITERYPVLAVRSAAKLRCTGSDK